MPSLLAGLAASLAVWQLAFVHRASAQSSASGDVSLCGISDFWNSTVVPYSFNNNKWGDDGSGYSCMAIAGQGTSFSVQYKWLGDFSTVKAFPYLKLDPARLPVQLWNVSSLHFSGQWSITVDGTESQTPQQEAIALDNTALKANVAIDMFLSDNAQNSTGLNPPFEIMIWFFYVPFMYPLGHDSSTPDIDTVEVSGMKFSLYHGFNSGGQHVFSWLPQQNLTSTNADFSPLLKYIWQKGMLPGALYLGQIEFGTEVMHADVNTTFSATNYDLKLIRDGDADAPQTTTSRNATTSTSTSTSASSTSTSTTTTTSSVTASPTALLDVSTTHLTLAPTASGSNAMRIVSHVNPMGLGLGLWSALVTTGMAGIAAFCI